MAPPLPRATTLASLFLLVLLVLLLLFAYHRHQHHKVDGDLAWGAEEEQRWGQGSTPDGKGTFEYSATRTGGGKSFSFGWSKGGDGVARGGSTFAGNWNPNGGGAEAKKK